MLFERDDCVLQMDVGEELGSPIDRVRSLSNKLYARLLLDKMIPVISAKYWFLCVNVNVDLPIFPAEKRARRQGRPGLVTLKG